MDIKSRMREQVENPLLEQERAASGIRTAGMAIRQSIRDRDAAASKGEDTVTISEEGRAKAAESDKERIGNKVSQSGSGMISAPQSKDSEEMSEAERTKAAIKKQINQVKEKLEDAQQRLTEATAKEGGQAASAVKSAPKTVAKPGEEGEEKASANAEEAVKASLGLEGGGMEAKAIQAEITQFQAQLQVLYKQLQEASKGSSGVEGYPTGAGIASGGTGNGGLGERISVSA